MKFGTQTLQHHIPDFEVNFKILTMIFLGYHRHDFEAQEASNLVLQTVHEL